MAYLVFLVRKAALDFPDKEETKAKLDCRGLLVKEVEMVFPVQKEKLEVPD